MEVIENFFGSIKDFIMENGNNPIFWLVIFFGGLIIFGLAYSALHKN